MTQHEIVVEILDFLQQECDDEYDAKLVAESVMFAIDYWGISDERA